MKPRSINPSFNQFSGVGDCSKYYVTLNLRFLDPLPPRSGVKNYENYKFRMAIISNRKNAEIESQDWKNYECNQKFKIQHFPMKRIFFGIFSFLIFCILLFIIRHLTWSAFVIRNFSPSEFIIVVIFHLTLGFDIEKSWRWYRLDLAAISNGLGFEI